MPRIGVGEVRISEKAKQNVARVLDTRRLSYGPFSREFERRFADLHGKRFACFVSSGTDALRIGLAALKEKHHWGRGSVVVPALTFVASVNAIIQVGLWPRFVDIELDTYGIGKVDEAYGDVAIMPVHLFGHPVKREVITWAREHGYRIIDDSCESMFVPGIADGDVSCFSTYACHVISTGVGGLAATDDPELATLIRSYANHGRDGIYVGIDDALGNHETMDARFRFERSGFSSRATELEAAIGCAELDEWRENIESRRRVASQLYTELCGLPLYVPRTRYADSSWMMFPIRTEDQKTRDALTLHLERSGIETRPLLPLLSQPYIRSLFGDMREQYPNAWTAETTGFYVGSYPSMSEEDTEHIGKTFRDFFRTRDRVFAVGGRG